jgi:hypothetical protein
MISTAALRDENVAALQRSPTLRAKSRVKRARLTASALSHYDRLSNIETTRRQCGSGEVAMGVLIGQVPAVSGLAAGLPGWRWDTGEFLFKSGQSNRARPVNWV